MQTYTLYSRAEGHSEKSIAIVSLSLRLFARYLTDNNRGISLTDAGPPDVRLFSLQLKSTPAFARHPLTRVQSKPLSGHTVNTYLRSLRAFYSWMVAEGFMAEHPFTGVTVAPPPRKVIATFSPEQVTKLMGQIKTETPCGFRDMTLILLLLDCGLRVSEAINLTMDGLSLEEGTMKVLGKGNKERQVPVGRTVVRLLLRYITRFRPEPANLRITNVFLSDDGYPMKRNRINKIISRYSLQAGIVGVRCSPHTLRHSAAVSFLRNGGNLFALQKMLGHACLDMTRRYCELADIDVKKAHMSASPVDNLDLGRRGLKNK